MFSGVNDVLSSICVTCRIALDPVKKKGCISFHENVCQSLKKLKMSEMEERDEGNAISLVRCQVDLVDT